MTIERKIAWEKFTPHYEKNQQDVSNIFSHANKKEKEDESNEWIDEEEEEEEENTHPNIMGFGDLSLLEPQVRTPFGFYDAEDDFSPYNMFECWIGHTNFRITKNDFNILNKKIEGIGCLKIISPYRFFIGIEKMFTFPSVRIQVQKQLCNNISEENFIYHEDEFDVIISKMNDALFSVKDCDKWAIFVDNSNGDVTTIKNSQFKSDEEYQSVLNEFKTLKNINIITYDSL